MIVSVSLTCIYLVALFVMLSIYAGKKQRQAEKTGITRKINPKLGCLGVLGFLGFAGFWTYSADGTVFPFAFFLFFGFFGFYYEGKMSGTFSLALALGIFLSEYLLYRYDHDDQAEEGEE